MQTETPTISVIIPTFQEGEYLARTLSNIVHAQSDIEVIVVDSNSKDNTIEVAEHFTKKVYKIPERGISKARNYGATKAGGDILIFLDADVLVPKDFADRIVETFKDSKVVGATCNIVPSEPRLSEKMFFAFYNRLIQVSGFLPFTRFKRHSRGEFFTVRRNEFRKIGGFNESLACLEDYDLAYRLSYLGKFAYIKNLTVYESSRRIRKQGLLKTVWIWFINFLSYVSSNRTISKVWRPVR